VKCTEDLQKRQGESIAQLNNEAEKSWNERRFELLNSATDKLKDKLAGGNPMTCCTEVTQLRESIKDFQHNMGTDFCCNRVSMNGLKN
jgi:hypothetical protein